jgi:hypothetical protein
LGQNQFEIINLKINYKKTKRQGSRLAFLLGTDNKPRIQIQEDEPEHHPG